MRPLHLEVFKCLQCLLLSLLVKSQSTRSTPADGESQFPGVDPTVALEGQCVVVCDAIQSQARHAFPSAAPAPKRIAFSVQKTSNTGLPWTPDERDGPAVVTFDYVLLNIGNAFDSFTGTFVVPAAGVYSLDFNIYKLYNRNAVKLELTINGVALFTAYANDNSTPPQLARNGGLVHLNAGDRVRIEIREGSLDGGWRFSSFSGHLLYEDRY